MTTETPLRPPLITRLRRRWRALVPNRGVAWTLRYIGFACTISQGVALLSDVYSWPETVPRLALSAVALLLPFAITVAYFQGHKARDDIGRPEAALLLISLAAFGFGLWRSRQYFDERAAAAVPDVALQFTDVRDPQLMIFNQSNSIIRNLVWEPLLWDVDSGGPVRPLVIPASPPMWIRPREHSAYEQIIPPTVAASLKIGDQIYGTVVIGCPKCKQWRFYILALRWGESGWTHEGSSWAKDRAWPQPATTEGLTQLVQRIDALVPASRRTAIGPLE